MPAPAAQTAATALGSGFVVVGSVAVLAGDEQTATFKDTGFGIERANLATVSRRFVSAFGDDYDQIAVFLAFDDRSSPNALAYQQPIKNDVEGLGLDLFDATSEFGSPTGRLETVLNMKRVTLYGRDAAEDPDNDLYSVWAQEAAHRWVAYFKYRLPGDAMDRTDLLLRQNAHWAPWVEADGSFLDGWKWKDNGDGTFTPVERSRRYGALDQYGMGLRTAEEVPPFFLLDDITDIDGTPVLRRGPFRRGARYRARKIDLGIGDIVRAHGPRKPARDPSAEDLRMGVVLLGPPNVPAADLVGEASRIDNTRRLWTEFYNDSGGGRGKVCTDLLRPCRGNALAFGQVTVTERTGSPDGVLSPGEPFTLTIPATSVGNEAAAAEIEVKATPRSALRPTKVQLAPLAPGATSVVTIEGTLPANTPCGQPIQIDTAATGRLGPSKASHTLVVGLVPAALFDFETDAAAAGWRVNPAGVDATSGDAGVATPEPAAFVVGQPQRNEVAGFVLQPGAAVSGARALVTGAATGERPQDGALTIPRELRGLVAERTTTAESPIIALTGLRDPRLSYWAHFAAAAFRNEVLVSVPSDDLRVLASVDGATWVEVDRVAGMQLGWQRRLVRLADKLPAAWLDTATLRLRFVARNVDDGNPDLVEAAVDDVGIYGVAAECRASAGDGGADPTTTSEGGCGCAVGRRTAPSPARLPFAIVALMLAACYARRRRAP